MGSRQSSLGDVTEKDNGEGHEEDKERPEGIEEWTAKERCCRV